MKNKNVHVNALKIESLSIDGLSIRTGVRKGKDGGVPLLLLNGIGAPLEMLMPFVDELSYCDIILIDVPGSGESTAPTLPWRLRDYAKLCASALDQMGVDTVNVMGISWGGTLAQQFARQFPDRCERLILAATSPGHLMFPGKLSAIFRMVNPRRYFDKNYMKSIAGSIYGGKMKTSSRSVERVADLTRPPSKRGYYYQFLAVVGWSSLTWLRKIRQPTMVMHGVDDPIVPMINAKIIARLVPNSQFQSFNCGHLFMLTQSTRVAGVVQEFIEDGATSS